MKPTSFISLLLPSLAAAACSPLNAILPQSPIATYDNLLDIFITPALPGGLLGGPSSAATRWPLVISDLPGAGNFFYNLTLGAPGSENNDDFRHGAFYLQNNQLYANGGALATNSANANVNLLQPQQLYISLSSDGANSQVDSVMYCKADGKAVPVLSFPLAVLNMGSFLTKGAPKTGDTVFAPLLALGIGGTPVLAEIVEVV